MGFDLYLLDYSHQYVSAYDKSLKAFPYLMHNLPHYCPSLQPSSFPLLHQLLEPECQNGFEPVDILAEVDQLDQLLHSIEWPFFEPRKGKLSFSSIEYCPQPLSPHARFITEWAKVKMIDNRGNAGLFSFEPPCSLLAFDSRLVLVSAAEEALRLTPDWRTFPYISAKHFEWRLPVPPGHEAAELPLVDEAYLPYYPAVLLADGAELRDAPSSFYYDFLRCESMHYQALGLDQVWKDEITRLRDACREAGINKLLIGSSN